MPRQARFTVVLDKASDTTVSADYATRDGTATAPDDYTATAGTLEFAPGETSKDVVVPVRDDIEGAAEERFTLEFSNPVGLTVADGTGIAILPGVSVPPDAVDYAERFRWMYDQLRDPDNGYFSPASAGAPSLPYHIPETLIVEAPDWGHQTVSETASFWVGLEAMKGIIDGAWSGYNEAWAAIEDVYIPSDTNQPVGAYSPSSPADYTPEADTPDQYPRLGDPNAAKGVDGLYNELVTTYGTKSMYLMHWILDVDGVYGFHNGDGATKNVYMNNYQRGLQESAWETVPHPEWEDWQFGSDYGYLPLFSKGKPVHSDAPFDFGKQWRYTAAPDAEARTIQWAFWANKFATASGSASAISASDTKAKKMGDYLRYALMDKYFRQIGPNRAEGSTDQDPYLACHFLVSWYVSWGGEVPANGQEASWGFRIGSSESHQGYQAPDIAYFMATGGGGYQPASPSAGDIWLGSLYRQMEMLRWLQTEAGPIAGGVTNSWLGRYETPTDGRQNATFYGMYYTYAPVWHDPPSNNWFGFQAWGLGRSADLLLEVADKNTELATTVRNNLEVILDRFVNWVLDTVQIDENDDFLLPDTFDWTTGAQVAGETTSTANLEGVYEFIPQTSWDGSGDYAAFWKADTVPNPSLKFEIVAWGKDIGVASSLAGLLIHYAQAKRVMGKFTSTIPNGGHTAQEAYALAKGLLDGIWTLYRDEKGVTKPEKRSDFARYGDPVYVPPGFTGTMPNGDPIENGATFISLRSFMKNDPGWPKVQAYLDSPVDANVPEFTYHRFWANAEYAISLGAMHQYFADLAEV